MTVDQAGPDLGRLVHVQLRNVPIDLYARARQHTDELQREFALISLGEGAPANSIPRRLLALIDELDSRFATFAEPTNADLDGAARRGESAVDVAFSVPEAAGPAAVTLDRLFDETDEFCRTGHFLTLSAQDDVIAFRKWFLGEFVRQIAGEPPQPWPGTAPD